ncbi:MAG: hypothetical protein QME62_10610 [Armatimonadota bacterium]|nr:hypothetical protein [Armatimonadota bacterium]
MHWICKVFGKEKNDEQIPCSCVYSLLLATLLSASACMSSVICVKSDGGDANGGLSLATAK